MTQYNFSSNVDSMPLIDQEIKEIEKLLVSSLINETDKYLELNKTWQWLCERRISNRSLSCEGIESKQTLICVSEPLGEWSTAKMMLDAESNDMGWVNIGYHNKNRDNPYDAIVRAHDKLHHGNGKNKISVGDNLQ